MESNSAYLALHTYMRRVAELTTSLEEDIKKGKKITASTVLSLSKLHASAQHMQKLLAVIERRHEPIN